MERTVVVSATNLMARGFLVVPTDRRGKDGQPVNGLYAVARAVQRVLAWKAPARAVAVIETGTRTLEGKPWPAILEAQLAALPELCRALGLGVVTGEGEQSLVASYVQAALDRGDDVMIAGVDKRFAQLVSDRVWWYDANKDTRYTQEIVFKRFGVGPEQVGEWLGLVGDEDALPGVAGIGAKGATTLLAEHGSVAAALAALDTIKGRLGNALRAAQGEASDGGSTPGSGAEGQRGSIARELARAKLDRARSLPSPLDACTYAPLAAAPLNELYERLGFVELLVSDAATTTNASVLETPEAVAAALASLAGTVAIAALLEDPAPLREELTGVALSTGQGAYYVACASGAWPAIAAWLASDAPKVGHDLGGTGTAIALARRGITLGGLVGDSGCASHALNPSVWAPHELAVVAKHVLGRALPEEATLRGVGQKRKAWRALPVERAADAAGGQAEATAAIWAAIGPQVEPARMADYLALADTAVRMEERGLLVDLAALDTAEAAFATLEAELTTKIEGFAGRSFNINSTKQLGEVLFAELKLPIASHTKTGWSTATEALEKIEGSHPIVPLVIRWRLLRKLQESWVAVLRKCIDTDGRVHSRFHVARSFSGHLVNTSPDLTRVPGRTPEMAMIRRAFVAAPGRLLMSVDFNQLGLHVLAHLTKDPALVEPLRARADMHRLTASAVLETAPEAITDEQRQLGKVVNFATFAGQGASALALQLGVPAAEAKEMIARFDRRYALVRSFQEEQLRLARERGYITTIAGRRWTIGGLESLDSQLLSYAERMGRRATHEGSVADVARKALLDSDRALRAAGLDAMPVHEIIDEVLFDVRADQLADVARVAAEAMRTAYSLEVPLVVGVEAGPNWADLTPVVP